MANVAQAETTVTPYFSLGAYHRDCHMTDPMICTNNQFGSDTPGTIDAGFRFESDKPRFYYLWADQVDVGWHHQSYVDRGFPFNGDPEAQIDMFGARFTWEVKSLSFKLPF